MCVWWGEWFETPKFGTFVVAAANTQTLKWFFFYVQKNWRTIPEWTSPYKSIIYKVRYQYIVFRFIHYWFMQLFFLQASKLYFYIQRGFKYQKLLSKNRWVEVKLYMARSCRVCCSENVLKSAKSSDVKPTRFLKDMVLPPYALETYLSECVWQYMNPKQSHCKGSLWKVRDCL